MNKADQRKAFAIGAEDLGVMDVLIYGNRVPHGLMDLIWDRPEHIHSVTAVGHGALGCFWLNARLRPFLGDRLTILRMDDPLGLPYFGDRKFGFAYSTARLAETFDPRPHVETVLRALNPTSACYFDLNGTKGLDEVFVSRGFRPMAVLDGKAGFFRSTAAGMKAAA